MSAGTDPVAAVPALPAPSAYLARDYASFRQLLLDRLTLSLPQWRERHVPDGYLMLVEMLSYLADHISYEQDAAGTEAYLATARRRISVRRHARLVDYDLHEGCNARTWICLEVASDQLLDPASLCFITTPRTASPPLGVLTESSLWRMPSDYLSFEPMLTGPLDLRRDRNAIAVHGAPGPGATRARLALAADDPAVPPAGSVLILEPDPSQASDGGPLAHAVRLIADPVAEAGTVVVEWGAEDGLPADFPSREGMIARANVVLVDSGIRLDRRQRLSGSAVTAPAAEIVDGRAALAVSSEIPGPLLTWRVPLRLTPATSAAAMLAQDPRQALAEIDGVSMLDHHDDQHGAWQQRRDLLDSGPAERHYAVEVDDDNVAWLRFGDGQLGMPPAAHGVSFGCRIGNGAAGNVAADSIRNVVTDDVRAQAITSVRNPLPASGGQDPEAVDAVRLAAPAALRAGNQRAVIAADYAEIAAADPEVQQAVARLRWSVSRFVVELYLDPHGSTDLSAALRDRISQTLAAYRLIGHEVQILAARYLPVELALRIVPAAGYNADQVELAVRRSLVGTASSRQHAFFAPDAHSFAGALAESQLLVRVMRVPGVRSARLLRLRRYGTDDPDLPPNSLLRMGWNEIARLDNRGYGRLALVWGEW